MRQESPRFPPIVVVTRTLTFCGKNIGGFQKCFYDPVRDQVFMPSKWHANTSKKWIHKTNRFGCHLKPGIWQQMDIVYSLRKVRFLSNIGRY